MGLIVGYHLQLGGTAITYLGRPERVSALSRPQVLYGLHDYYLERTRLPAHRILNGALGMMCHPVATFRLPVHPPTDAALHHGIKVRAQDIELLKGCVKVGEREGKLMAALRELLDRVETKHPVASAT
jgi:hypothetical protein